MPNRLPILQPAQHLSSITYEALQDCETTNCILKKKDFKELVSQSQHLKDKALSLRDFLFELVKFEQSTVMTTTSPLFLIMPKDSMVDPNVLEEVA